ncbi:MAG: carboxypeptidase-like regulatory domain-containing protein, partial [Vicinamibacterales bacterium]
MESRGKYALVLMATIVALLGLSTSASAQFDTATVVGTVKDSSGGAVPNAKVTLTNVETGISDVRTSNAEGNFEFVSVRAGAYLVSGEKEGFSIALMDNVRVEVGARLRADLQLEVGSLSEEVKVTAEAKLVETDNSQRSQILSTVQIQQLPLNGRQYAQLALLSTGVRRSSTAAARDGAFNVNGLRNTMNNFMLDGLDNNAYATSNQGQSSQVMQPAPDSLAEVQVITNNESAEYGHSAGATVNASYRSGTNQLHGSGWDFFRNTALNASTYFAPPGGQKASLEYSQFGGVLGGPIVRNRMFFFADYEGLRQRTGGVSFATIPTASEQQGIFSVDVRDPRTGQLYAAGTPIPMTSFARKVMNDLPDPTSAGVANNYAVQRYTDSPSDKASGKVDFQVSQRIRAFGRYSWRDANINSEAALPLPSGSGGNFTYATTRQIALGTTFVQSNRSVLEVRFGWSSVHGLSRGFSVGTTGALETYGISGLPTDPRISGGLPTQIINGYTNLGRGAANPQWQFPST